MDIAKAFERLKENVKCSYCQELKDNIVSNLSCKHTLCSACAFGSDICPFCKTTLNDNDKKENLFINGIISTLKSAVSALSTTDDGLSKVENIIELKTANENVQKGVVPAPSVPKTPDSGSPANLGRNTRSSSAIRSKVEQRRNNKGETPLQVACKKNDTDAVKCLLESGANPNTKDYAGWTPLHEAVLNSNMEMVEILLKHGALIDVPGLEYATPLHTAAFNGCEDVVEVLLQHGASTQLRNVYGQIPIDQAKNKEIIQMLQDVKETQISKNERNHVRTEAKFPVVFVLEKVEQKLREKFKKFEKCGKIRLVSTLKSDVSHIVVPSNEKNICPSSPSILKGILLGAAIVNADWLVDCLSADEIIPFESYEVNGTIEYPNSDGPRKARLNFLNLLPPLLEGCQIYIHPYWTGSFDKNVVSDLVKCSSAVLLSRPPNPEFVETGKILYHSKPGSSMEFTLTIVLYQDDYKEPTIKYDMPSVKTLPLSWFLKCIETFSIAEP